MSVPEPHYDPPAGWYPDVEDPYARRRYWDGAAWTDRVREIEGHYIRHPEDPPQPLGAPRTLAVCGLVVIALVEAFNIVVDFAYVGLMNDYIDGGRRSQADLDSLFLIGDVGSWALLVAYLLIGPVIFLPWFARAYSNLPRLGILPLRFKPGWAIGAWFIPIFNLIRPKQIADDLYRGSRADAPGGRGFRELRVSPLLHWWWGLFLIQRVISVVAGNIGEDAADEAELGPATVATLEQMRTAFLIDVGASLLAIAAAALAIRVVTKITGMQTDVMRKASAADRTD